MFKNSSLLLVLTAACSLLLAATTTFTSPSFATPVVSPPPNDCDEMDPPGTCGLIDSSCDITEFCDNCEGTVCQEYSVFVTYLFNEICTVEVCEIWCNIWSPGPWVCSWTQKCNTEGESCVPFDVCVRGTQGGGSGTTTWDGDKWFQTVVSCGQDDLTRTRAQKNRLGMAGG